MGTVQALSLIHICVGERDVDDFGVQMELHAVVFQIVHRGQDEGFELVVLGEAQRAEVGQPADMVHETLDVALHLERAVPVLEAEHGAPVPVSYTHLDRDRKEE